jgi:hypothetical protein
MLKSDIQYVPYLNFRIDTRDRDEMFGRITAPATQIRKAAKITAYGARHPILRGRQFTDLRNRYIEKLRKPFPCENFFLEFYRKESWEVPVNKA